MTLTFSAGVDRRRAPASEARLEVRFSGWAQVEDFYTTVLCHGGLRFVSLARIALDTPLRVVLQLPDSRRLDLPAEVRQLRAENDVWVVGVEFVDTPSMSASVLDAVLDTLR